MFLTRCIACSLSLSKFSSSLSLSLSRLCVCVCVCVCVYVCVPPSSSSSKREKEALSKLMGTLRKSQVKGVAAALKSGGSDTYASIGRRRGQRSLLSPPTAAANANARLSRSSASSSHRGNASKAQDVDTLIADIMSANTGLRTRRLVWCDSPQCSVISLIAHLSLSLSHLVYLSIVCSSLEPL
jgi:hypothetical protein